MRIYTKSGDDGSTGLYGGRRVSKASMRVDVYGTIDELNACIGWARAAELPGAVDAVLAESQEQCFRLGSFLATVPGKDPGIDPLTEDDVRALEAAIDAAEDGLPSLKSFVLPGGVEGAARLHVARTVCRRAERVLVSLAAHESDTNPIWIRWLNRLSDLLFVHARVVNASEGVEDVKWEPRG